MDAGMTPKESSLAQRLIEFAQKVCANQEAYLAYVGVARDALTVMIEERIKDRREAGVATDGHDALLNQLRGLRSRFVDLDAIAKSLLLLVDGSESAESDEVVWEEILGHINALQGIELEGRAAQMRAALAAVLRDYVEIRSLKLDVEAYTAKRFHGLTSQIREVQRRRYSRDDSFTPEDCLERLIAFGSANVELLAQIGSPAILPPAPLAKR
jgi:hypothetical protein